MNTFFFNDLNITNYSYEKEKKCVVRSAQEHKSWVIKLSMRVSVCAEPGGLQNPGIVAPVSE